MAEYEDYVVSSGIKFPVSVRVNPAAGPTEQVHGFEVDLVGARANCLVLATVKSYFGSTGVELDDYIIPACWASAGPCCS